MRLHDEVQSHDPPQNDRVFLPLMSCEKILRELGHCISCSPPSFRNPKGLGHYHREREEGNPTKRFASVDKTKIGLVIRSEISRSPSIDF